MASILFLVHRIPYPPNKGDKVRSFHILKHLAARYSVRLGALMDDPEDARHIETLKQWTTDQCIVSIAPRWQRLKSLRCLLTGQSLTQSYFEVPRLRRWVEEQGQCKDLRHVLIYSSGMAPYVLGEAWRGHRRIADLVDVDSAKFAQYAQERAPPMKYLFARETRLLSALERRVAAEFDASVLVTEPEAALMRQVAPESAARIHCVENGVDTQFFDPGQEFSSPYQADVPVAVFTGAMDYPPNVQAVEWFARMVWPKLQLALPAAQFWIVGARPLPQVLTLAAIPGIKVTGTVPDVRPYLKFARVAVAPLLLARGVQNKVLEALAMALPILASHAALEGIRLAEGVGTEGLATDGSAIAAWHLQLSQQLGSPKPEFNQRGRDWVQQHYAWSSQLGRLDQWLT